MLRKTTSTLLGLTLAVLPVGCEPSSSEKPEPPKSMKRYTMINLADGEDLSPALIVDENRDENPDYIAEYTGAEKEKILWLREGYKPTLDKFVITDSTRIFEVPSQIRDLGVQNLVYQRSLSINLMHRAVYLDGQKKGG